MKKINWKKLKPIIFNMVKKGASSTEISRKIGVNHNTFYKWWRDWGKREYDRITGKINKEPVIVNYADIFKKQLKVGDKIITDKHKGVVTQMYEHIFVVNFGKYVESFGYNCFNDVKILGGK